MAIKNQGYRQDLNLSEHTDDTAVWSNLYSAGISNDLAVMRNNLRNTSTVGFSSLTGNGASGIASFFTTLKENGEPTDFIFTNDDVVGVSQTVTFGTGAGSTTITKGKDYYVCSSDSRNKFKLSLTSESSDVGVSTIVQIVAHPSVVDTEFGPITQNYDGADPKVKTSWDFIRKDPVHRPNLVNFVQPEVQDNSSFSWFGGNTINDTFVNTSSNNEIADYFIDKKYRGNGNVVTDRDVKYEGSMVVGDPSDYNQSQSDLEAKNPDGTPDTPGVFIGNTRAFSTDNNPWAPNGTENASDATLKTESHEVTIGNLDFLNEVEVTGVSKLTTSGTNYLKDYSAGQLWKIPMVINGETYYLLMDQAT